MGLLRTALPCLGAVIALAVGGDALAQQPSGIRSAPAWYVGAGAGVSWYDMKNDDRNVIPTITTGGFDATGFGWKIFGGYRFNNYFGLEGSYADLGNTSGGVTYAVHSWNVAAVGRIPFGTGFYMQLKGGAAFTRTQASLSGQPGSNTVYKTNPLAGLGFGYDFASGWGLLAEAEWYGTAGSTAFVDPNTGQIGGTGRADAYLFSVSSMLRF